MGEHQVAKETTDAHATVGLNEESKENLVETAIKFLQHPKVRNSALSQKRAFLENKGLTAEQINIALEKSGALYDERTKAVGINIPSHYVPPPPIHTNSVVTSSWVKARDICTTIILASGTIYGLYQFAKKYILPYLLGHQSDEEKQLSQLEKMIEFQSTTNKTMLQLQNTLRELQNTLQQMCKKQDIITQAQVSPDIKSSTEIQLKDLHSEITSIKGLLLNRHQFPAVPTINPIIPTWQMNKPDDNSEVPNGDNNHNLAEDSNIHDKIEETDVLSV